MYLEKMGIYGMGKIETAVLAGLVTGDPVLFIGTHGTAKTTLCRKLAESLGLKFIAYDASKALFEDMIGFPNPESISKGEIEYVPTKLSIWDKEFILVDEISRARAEMQNKWLEIIRGRQVMGMRAQKLKYVFAAMNPPEYAGANPLDEALAGRFAFVIRVPDASSMTEEELIQVINNKTDEDAAALKKQEKKMDKSGRLSLEVFIKQASARYCSVLERCGSDMDSYIVKLLFFGGNKEVKIDGRRAGMIKRNLAAYIAVHEMLNNCEEKKFFELDAQVFDALCVSLPFEASGEALPKSKIKYLHDTAFEFASGGYGAAVDIKSGEQAEQLDNKSLKEKYMFYRPVITKIIEKVKNRDNPGEKEAYLPVLKTLVKRVQDGTLSFEPNDAERLLEAYSFCSDMSVKGGYVYSGVHFFSKLVREGEAEISPASIKLYRFVYNLLKKKNEPHADLERVKKYIRQLKALPSWR